MCYQERNQQKLILLYYLLFCEDRSAYQCWPRFKTIGKATGMSLNTVRKYVRMLEDWGLITTKSTNIMTKGGQKRNGNLLFTIHPIQEAVEQFYREQMEKIFQETQREKISAVKLKQERPA